VLKQPGTTMSNATHTPGPWHVRSSEGQQSHVVYAADNYAIANATTYHGQHPLHCAEANAHLIAAAPELLQQCLEITAAWQVLERKWKEGIEESEYVKGVRHGFKNAAAMVVDEIAKATGKAVPQ
jgi:hypothetical protein